MSLNSIDPTLPSCPQCGAQLPAEAPRGLCPKCLMLAVAAPTEAGSRSSGPRGRPPAPSIETIAAAFPQLEILEMIGQGGMGAVYKARQPRLNRFVALKLLPESLGQDAAFAERFAREGQLLARLNHPNIVNVHDFGQAGGFYFLLMEYVDGVNLRQAMSAGRFSPEQALAIVPRICEALQFAHDEGVLHRDIKPENILLDAKGRVKLVDFGIAKLVDGTDTAGGLAGATLEASLTQSGAALGTPNYMAPEQVARPAGVDHRADIYSLGVVFYELLTGELPRGGFARPSERTPVGADVDAIVLRALEKDRDRRQQSAMELKTQLENLQPYTRSSAPLAPPPVITPDETVLVSPARRSRRTQWPVMAAGGALAVAVALVWILNRPGHPQRPPLVSQDTRGVIAPVDSKERLEFILELDRGWVNSNANAIAIMSQSGVAPGQSVVAMARYPDGRVDSASSTVSILNRGGRSMNTLSFSWHLPASFSQEKQELAWESIRSKHLRRPLHLVAGEPYGLFSVTNEAGGVMSGWLEYRAVSNAERSQLDGSAPVRTLVRLKPQPPMPGWQSVACAADVPPGHMLQAICRGTAASDGEAHTSLYLQSAEPPSCTWFVRGNFKPEHFRPGAEQLERLRASGPLEVAVGTPRRLFSLTNDLGETFEGWLELLGPAGNGKTKPTPPTISSGASPGPTDGKTIVLTGATNEIRGEQSEIRTVSVHSGSLLLPGERLMALRQNPDGRIEPASVSFFVHRRRGSSSTSTYLTWFVPDSFSPALMAQAAFQIQREFSDRPLRLDSGQARLLFTITNQAGGTLAGWIQFEREIPPSPIGLGAGGNRPDTLIDDEFQERVRQQFGDRAALMKHLQAQGMTFDDYRQRMREEILQGIQARQAVVRIRPNSRHGILFYSATTPPGYRLEAMVGGSEPIEGDSSTSMSSSGNGADFHCSWRVPDSFKSGELRAADEQIQALAAKGPVTVAPGVPQKVFSVTNSAGEVFEGLFALLGPNDANADARSSSDGNPGAPLPEPADLRRLAGKIAQGDQTAFDELRRVAQELYRGINHQKDTARVITNFALMSAAFETLGAEIGSGNSDALEAVRQSLSFPHLKSFAPRALGAAAAAGHEESLQMLLEHGRWGILLSTTVSALRGAAARNDERAVEFLADVLSNPAHKALWQMASAGLTPAANAGNARAIDALKAYEASRKP